MLSKRAQTNEEADETHGNEKPVRLANNTVCRVAILADQTEIKIEAPLVPLRGNHAQNPPTIDRACPEIVSSQVRSFFFGGFGRRNFSIFDLMIIGRM